MNKITDPKILQFDFSQNKTNGLTLAAYISLKRLTRSKYQLKHIMEEHPERTSRQKAKTYSKKIEKLISIALGLIDRLKAFSNLNSLYVVGSDYSDALLEIREELTLFDDMHFEMAKGYSPFIYENYEVSVIPINTTYF